MNIIRVSTVLKLLYPGGLSFVEQHHLDEGTRKHELMELYVNNRLMGYPYVVPPIIQPRVDWLETEGIQPESAEEFICHRWGYGGHPDFLGTQYGEPIWTDWKFSEAITEQNQMQGTVYTKLTGRKGFFLQCRANGKVKAVRCKPDPMLWAAFLAGLSVKKFHISRGAE